MVGWQEGFTAVVEILIHVFIATCSSTVTT